MSKEFYKYNNPQFDKATRVHDWRNYVPQEFKDKWDDFTLREKEIIFKMAEIQADNEEWD